MDAVVEVGTAKATAVASKSTVVLVALSFFRLVVGSVSTPTSTTVPSISGHSISAVAPDHTFFRKDLALAA